MVQALRCPHPVPVPPPVPAKADEAGDADMADNADEADDEAKEEAAKTEPETAETQFDTDTPQPAGLMKTPSARPKARSRLPTSIFSTVDIDGNIIVVKYKKQNGEARPCRHDMFWPTSLHVQL